MTAGHKVIKATFGVVTEARDHSHGSVELSLHVGVDADENARRALIVL